VIRVAARPPVWRTSTELLKNRQARSRAAANPSTPLEALTSAGHLGWILSNPRVPEAQVRSLLDRALNDADDSAADACKELLAARALRASS
jgi:hypothetical protein